MTLIVVTRESHLISHHIMMTTRPMMKRIKIAPALTVEPSPTSNINIPWSATMLTKPSPNIAPSCRWMVIFLSSFLSIEARGKYFVKCRSEMDRNDSLSFQIFRKKTKLSRLSRFYMALSTH